MDEPSSPAGRSITDISDVLLPVFARRWLILIIVVVASGAAYIHAARKPDRFEASTKIYLGEQGVDPLTGQGPIFANDREVENQATLLTSSEAVADAARRIHYRGSLGALGASVSATPSEGSDFVSIEAHAGTADLAARIANGFAETFIARTIEVRRAKLKSQLSDLQGQFAATPGGLAGSGERIGLAQSIRKYQVALRHVTTNARQVSRASPPAAANSHKPLRNALFAAVLALLAGVGLALGLERFDRRLTRVDDAGAFYDLPVLGTLPHDEASDYVTHGLSAVSPPLHEPFRSIRANLQLMGRDRPPSRILVTSAVSGEGKSTVVRNLAIVFRELGLRVAVVDCDLRSPTLAKLLHADVEPGFTDVYYGHRQLADVMVRVGVEAVGIPQPTFSEHADSAAAELLGLNNGGAEVSDMLEGITLVPAGGVPANPSTILGASRTRELLHEISRYHDLVLIDSPPLLAVSDTIPLLAEVDAVILVMRLGLTTRPAAQRVTELLGRAGNDNEVGIIVNDMSQLEGRAHGYGYGYGYPHAS